MQINRKIAIGALGVIGVAGLAGTAFAASISGLTTRNAGQGAGTFSGYAVTVQPRISTGSWTSGNGTAATVGDVVFTMTKAGGGTIVGNTTVYAQLTGGTASNWVACTVAASNVVTCPFSGKEVSTVEGISIVAYDS